MVISFWVDNYRQKDRQIVYIYTLNKSTYLYYFLGDHVTEKMNVQGKYITMQYISHLLGCPSFLFPFLSHHIGIDLHKYNW